MFSMSLNMRSAVTTQGSLSRASSHGSHASDSADGEERPVEDDDVEQSSSMTLRVETDVGEVESEEGSSSAVVMAVQGESKR